MDNNMSNKDSIIFGSINEAEQYFKKQYGCYTTYFVSNCTVSGPSIDYSCIVNDKNLISNDDFDNINSVHNKNTINLIFPNEGMRVSGNMSFMNQFPFVKTLLGEKFNKDNFVQYHYIEQIGIEEHTGSTTIIIENELESIFLENNYIIKSKLWKSKSYWEIEDVIISNLYTLIVQFNSECYYNDNFKSYDVIH
jgi:hypothetical protein